MNGLIYLVGLIVVLAAILSLLACDDRFAFQVMRPLIRLSSSHFSSGLK